MRPFCLLVLVLLSADLAGQTTVTSLPNQKLIDGSYVSNPDNILSDATVTQIDTLLSSLEKKTTVQVAVVAVASIGDDDVTDFAQRLFSHWGIGDKSNNNGLLLLLVKDARTVRFHTGYGLEGVLPDALCKRIQTNYMVPQFKTGNYDAGVLEGIKEVDRILTDPNYAEELKKSKEETGEWAGFVAFLLFFFAPIPAIAFVIKNSTGKFADSKKDKYTPYPEMRLTRRLWLIKFVGIPLLIILFFGFSGIENSIGFCVLSLYLYYMVTLFLRLWRMRRVINRFLEKQEYTEIVEFIRKQQLYWLLMAFLFPLPFFFYFFYHLTRKRRYRNHPRTCTQCQGAMRKLSEKEEDEYLTKGQQTEETLRAVDYDVWKCTKCDAIDFWFFLNRFSKYTDCPRCRTLAYYSVSTRTVKNASYTSSGTGEEVHACKHCGYTRKSTYTIAQLTQTSSSSSSSFGSSSSGGGSWGGGSSGGGGASSSW